ncbi:MAG: DUF169 domain-containing protein [Candidatus Eremiobacteraeota bacterium]|nr:DUF169 domain-containing protein [Candidatus Eremiobacteraeota bacterium]
MNKELHEKFVSLWDRYFHGAELPIAFFYTDNPKKGELARSAKGHRCMIGDLALVRKGKSLLFNADNLTCPGGKRYLGYSQVLAPKFEYFLSCGIPGELEGERYKKSPEIVKEFIKHVPTFEAPGKYIAFVRWDHLADEDEPEAVIFFAGPDVLSGLFTLANFDAASLEGHVGTPFGSGCMSIVHYPLLEKKKDEPRAILGMFDPSARPSVPDWSITFTVPPKRFRTMVLNMEESFLTTPSWNLVSRRIEKRSEGGSL